MRSLLAWYHGLSDIRKGIIFFLLTIVSAAIIFFVTATMMEYKGHEAMKPYRDSQLLINNHFDSLRKPEILPQEYLKVFKLQQRILDERKKHYDELSNIFFRNYYGVLIITMLFSCVGGVILFLMINKGWKEAHPILKAIFLAIALVLTFCGFFPLVFKQEENFNENIKMYMNYTKAEVTIIDQLSRLENPLFSTIRDSVQDPADKTKKIERIRFDSTGYFRKVDSMIAVNTVAINTLSNYILSINAKEIGSITEISRSLQNNITAVKSDSVPVP